MKKQINNFKFSDPSEFASNVMPFCVSGEIAEIELNDRPDDLVEVRVLRNAFLIMLNGKAVKKAEHERQQYLLAQILEASNKDWKAAAWLLERRDGFRKDAVWKEEPEEETTDSGIVLSIKEEPKLEGELLALPKDAEWIGAQSGDVVGYRPNSEYEMELQDGTKVYRMRITELVYAKKD